MTNQAEVLTGRIGDHPIADLFQSLHDDRKTGVARFRTALGSATVWFRDGELVDADMGRFHMEAAVLRLLKIQDGEFEVEFQAISRRRVIKADTAKLLAEGRQRAPRRGRQRIATPKPAGQSISAQYSHIGTGVRDDSRPRRRPAPEEPRPSDTNAHTAVRSQPHVPAVADTDAHTVVGARSRVVEDAAAAAAAEAAESAQTRGPGRRRGPVASWHPTAGGTNQAPDEPPSATPPSPGNEEVIEPSTRGRTRFMFGVAGPAKPTPTPKPGARTPRPVPKPEPAVTSTPPAATSTAAEPGDGRRPRVPSQPRVQSFEPERLDQTLMRAGPIPPPPGAEPPISAAKSGAVPGRPAAAIPSVATPSPSRPRSEVVSAEIVDTPGDAFAPQEIISEEYSHPIAVPSAPSIGPGGTWMLGMGSDPASADQSPPDPTEEATFVMRSTEVIAQAAEQAGKTGKTAHVGRYEVLLRLARGGMGTVYLCRVTGEGGFRRLFALKVIRDHLNTNQAYVQMLLDEARIASRLNHPNIVSIIDIDTFAGQHFLVMDYVEGCTFSELVKAHPKNRPPELVVPIIIDALTGLHAAHSMRGDDGTVAPVVHCDFSPQNMLVGVNGTCRITDFGISKAADALTGGPGRGKPGYISPEQVRGLPLDPRSDIFSAGVVLWNALTGEQLFEGETPELVLHQVVSRKIPKPSTVGLRPPACFDRICLKALERDPKRRYQSAEQMLTELRKVAGSKDLLAPSSEIGRWVQESFGAQIEIRRQAAGLSPSMHAAGLALRDIGPTGPTGHPDGLPRDGSATGVDDVLASQTVMLERSPESFEDDDEGFGPRTRVVVLLAALAFGIAAVITLFVRPDLLQGGMLNEHGEYVESGVGDPLERQPVGSTGGGGMLGLGDQSTGTGDTGGDTDTDADTDTDTDTDADTDTGGTAGSEPPPDPPKGKRGKTKGGKTKGGKTKGGKTKGGKTKGGKTKGGKTKGGKSDSGDTPPPPDLDGLFEQPGG